MIMLFALLIGSKIGQLVELIDLRICPPQIESACTFILNRKYVSFLAHRNKSVGVSLALFHEITNKAGRQTDKRAARRETGDIKNQNVAFHQ